jgi:hypothetical protein
LSDLLLDIAERRLARRAATVLRLRRLVRHLFALLALFEKPSHRGNARAQHSAVELLPQSIAANRAAREVTGSEGGVTVSAQAHARRLLLAPSRVWSMFGRDRADEMRARPREASV